MFHRWLALATVLALGSTSCFAQSTQRFTRSRAPRPPAWAGEPWTEDNKPYQMVRATIDKAVAGGEKPDVLLQRYKAAALRELFDSKAQFGWGYAAWKTINPTLTPAAQAKNLRDVPEALRRGFKPSSDYVRLLFLLSRWAGNTVGLQNVGERLLKQDPQDRSVKYHLVGLLSVSRSDADQERALTYAQDLVRLAPKRASYYTVLGQAYVERWHRRRNLADADKAIAAYEKYLELAPESDTWRPEASKVIELLRQDRDALAGNAK